MDLIKMKTFNEILASLILALCVGALIYMAVSVLPSRYPDVQIHEYRYVLKVDSTGCLTNETRNQADSLIAAVKHHERSLNERYDYILQQKEENQKIYTIVGTILSVIVAIFGFFGYKNYKSIEEKAIATAGERVEEKMREFGKVQQDTLNCVRDKCQQTVKTETKIQFQEFKKNDLSNAISEMTKDIYKKNIESKLEKIDNLKFQVDDMENSQQSLLARIDELESHKEVNDKTAKFSIPSQTTIENEQTTNVNNHGNSIIDEINNHGKNR